MNIGELFVTIGIKGADKAASDAKGVQGELKETAALGEKLKSVFAGLNPFAKMTDGAKSFEDQLKKVSAALPKPEALKFPEPTGHWRNLKDPTKFGKDELGNQILGKTWVKPRAPLFGPQPMPKGWTPQDTAPATDTNAAEEKATKLSSVFAKIGLGAKNAREQFQKLFGMKGDGETEKTVKNVDSGLKQTASSAFAAKAAILGAAYAMQQMAAKSGAAGTGLTNFGALTGGSLKTIQQYQYAARQMGVSNEETAATFKSLQGAMARVGMGLPAPAGLQEVANLTGGISTQDITKFAEHPELLIQRLQLYASKEKRVGRRNEILGTFGLGDNITAAISRQAFKPEVLSKAPTYGDKEIASLDKANIAWSNLSTKIEMAMGHLNAAHGGKLVAELSKITDLVVKLAQSLLMVADKLKIFEVVGKMFEGLNLIMLKTAAIADIIAGKDKKTDVAGFFKELPAVGNEALKDFLGWLHPETQGAGGGSAVVPVQPNRPGLNPAPVIAPTPATGPQASNTSTLNLNQTLNFPATEASPQDIAKHVTRAVNAAYRQSSAQIQGS